MRALVLALFFACFSISSTVANDATGDYTLYLIRHAEKVPDGSRDPVLTEAGLVRSQNLANWFQDKNIHSVWSSDYKRTRHTATPLLLQSGLQLNIYDPGNLPALVRQLTDRQRSALIIGHSNTTPQLARLLCNCEITDMDDSEHDRLIMISFVQGEVTTKTLKQ